MLNAPIAKLVLLSLVSLSLVQAELAVAAQSAVAVLATTEKPDSATFKPLPDPLNKQRGEQTIQTADIRSVSDYLGGANSGYTPQQLHRFNSDWKRLLSANEQIGFVDDAKDFWKWWETNQANVLAARGAAGDQVKLQPFFAQVYARYKVEKTNAASNPEGFLAWLDKVNSNPTIRRLTEPTLLVTIGIAIYVGNIVKGATIAGPIGGIVSAFTEPMIRPVREKIAIIGNRLLGPLGVRLNFWLFGEKGPSESQKKASPEVFEAYQATRNMILNMAFDMTSEQYSENMKKLQQTHIMMNQIWVETTAPAMQNGRGQHWEIAGKNQMIAQNAINGVTASEVHRLGIDNMINEISQDSGEKRSVVRNLVDQLGTVVLERMHAEKYQPERVAELSEEVEARKKALLEVGGPASADARAERLYQVDRIIQNQRIVAVGLRHASTAVAIALYHDFQFPEYNRGLPKQGLEVFETLRGSFALEFFQKEYKHEVVRLLDQLGFKVQIANKAAVAQEKSPSASRKVVDAVTQTPEQARAAKQSELNKTESKTSAERAKEAVGRVRK